MDLKLEFSNLPTQWHTPPYSAKFPDPLWPWPICSFQSADYPGNNCQTQNSLFITWCGYLGSDQDRWTILGLARQVARRAPDTWGQTSNNRQGASKQEPALLPQQTLYQSKQNRFQPALNPSFKQTATDDSEAGQEWWWWLIKEGRWRESFCFWLSLWQRCVMLLWPIRR